MERLVNTPARHLRARRAALLRSLGWLLIVALALVASGAPVQAAARKLAGEAEKVAQATEAYLVINPYPYQLPKAMAGVPFAQAFTVSYGVAPYSFRLIESELPTGLTLSNDGVIRGTPMVVGSYGFLLNVTDAANKNTSQYYILTILSPMTMSPITPLNGQAGVPFRQVFEASGGVAPYSYAFNGILPPGLNFDANGVFSGTPAENEYYYFGVTVTDARGIAMTVWYSWYVAPALIIAPQNIPNAQVGVAYSQNLSVSGGVAPYTLALTNGIPPPGITLSASGLLSGTPSSEGSYFFTVSVTDAQGRRATQGYNLLVTRVPLTITPTILPDGKIGDMYRQRLTASGGAAPYTFVVADGTLPPGLTLNADGLLSGRPIEQGYFFFMVRAQDGRGRTGEQYYGLSISRAVLALSPTSLPNGKVGTTYRQRLAASGGTAPYTFSVAYGALPPGLSLSSDGRIRGRPTSAGSYYVSIQAADGRGNTGSQEYNFVIAQAIELVPYELIGGFAGTPYAQALAAGGGTAPYTFAVTEGVLPSGVTLSPAGILSGTPTSAGYFGFVATATDARGLTGSRFYFLSVITPVILSPAELLDGRVGTPYSQQFDASGGLGPYTFSVEGALPAGLSVSPSGLLSGVPEVAGYSQPFEIVATDSRGIRGASSYALQVREALTVVPPYLVPATLGEPYAVLIDANGGTAPYSFVVTEGTLPPGLALDASGLLHGTPASAGYTPFVITATDAQGRIGHGYYALNVERPILQIDPMPLPAGQVGLLYSQQLSARGGTAPYTFFASGLPGGLRLTPSGLLTGTPTQPGMFSTRLMVVDSQDIGIELWIDFVVDPILVGPETLPSAIIGEAYDQQLTVAGGTGPYLFLTTDRLPPGLVLSRSGRLSGTPTSTAFNYVSINVVDANGYLGSQFYLLAVYDPLSLPTASLPEGSVGSAYSAQVSAIGGEGDYRYEITAGNLAPGLEHDSFGTISGTPTLAGVYTFTFTVTDRAGHTAQQSYTIIIN